MSLYVVIPSRVWKHTSGAQASIYGAVPYTSDADRPNWKVVDVGYTVRNTETGIVGIGKTPSATAEEAQKTADYLNSLRRPEANVTKIYASQIKKGDTIKVPNYGVRTITYVRRNRRYAGFMSVQWDRTPADQGSTEANIRSSDTVEKVS